MSKHTPGKWVAIDDWWFASTSKDVVVVEESGIQRLLCEFTHSAFPEDNAANAQLIAAAPLMLEALKAIYGWEQRHINMSTGDKWDMVYEAILEAEGRNHE